MRTITLVNSDWWRAIPEAKRRAILRDMFTLADEKGWTIRVGGEHYGQ